MNRYSRYTSRQISLPAFMPSPNMYWPGGSLENWNALAQKDFQKNPWNYSQYYLYGGDGPSITEQYKKSKNGLGISKENNPFSKGNIGSTMQGIGAAASIIPEKPIKVGNIELKRGIWDAADPLYFLSDAKHTNAVGDTLSDAGVSLTKSGLQSGNPWIALAGGITKGLGSIVNAAFGGVDEEQKQKNDAAYNYYDSYKSNAKTYDDVTKFIGQDTFKGAYDGGWFRGGWARRHNAADYRDRSTAEGRAYTTRDNNLTNIGLENEMWARKHALAFGGPLDTTDNDNMGAIGFNFMSDYLTMKNNQNSKNNNNTQMPTFFSEGGSIEIKHPGRLTELKKRTGKTEAELWAEGKPDVRKMITFARSARRWNKHAEGGYLEGKVYDVPKDEVRRLISLGYEVECI